MRSNKEREIVVEEKDLTRISHLRPVRVAHNTSS